MKRSILLSIFIIGAIAAVVTGGAYSAWTDDADATGTISAATIDIVLDGDNDDDVTVIFSPQNLLPGESSDGDVSVNNNGTRDVHLTNSASVTSSDEVNCANANLTVSVSVTDTPPDDHGGNVHIADGDTETATISATLDNAAPAGCMGVTFTVDVTFTATGVADGA